MKILISLTALLILSGCSFSNSPKDEPAIRADDLEFAVDTFEENSAPMDPIQVAPEQIAANKIPDEFESMPEEPKFEDFKVPAEIKIEPITEPKMAEAKPQIELSADYEFYEVQKGDTLMMVAFKIYGDYRKWKELKQWNKEQLQGRISAGMKLRYYIPDQRNVWMPDGQPYLVKTGDTLQIISMDKYGTTKKWKTIYENNRPLIRDPDLIFAGFTLYYQPVRDLASQPR